MFSWYKSIKTERKMTKISMLNAEKDMVIENAFKSQGRQNWVPQSSNSYLLYISVTLISSSMPDARCQNIER